MTALPSRLPFGLDPLMAEAKRRKRRRWVFLGSVAVVLAAGVTAFGVERLQQRGDSVGTAPTHLTLLAVGGVGELSHWAFHLSCNPPRGNVPQPAQACASIAAQPSLITEPKPNPILCSGQWTITITGRMGGKPIHSKVATCWGPQMALINKLGLELSPR